MTVAPIGSWVNLLPQMTLAHACHIHNQSKRQLWCYPISAESFPSICSHNRLAAPSPLLILSLWQVYSCRKWLKFLKHKQPIIIIIHNNIVSIHRPLFLKHNLWLHVQTTCIACMHVCIWWATSQANPPAPVCCAGRCSCLGPWYSLGCP